jgi:hypothetical protein
MAMTFERTSLYTFYEKPGARNGYGQALQATQISTRICQLGSLEEQAITSAALDLILFTVSM